MIKEGCLSNRIFVQDPSYSLRFCVKYSRSYDEKSKYTIQSIDVCVYDNSINFVVAVSRMDDYQKIIKSEFPVHDFTGMGFCDTTGGTLSLDCKFENSTTPSILYDFIKYLDSKVESLGSGIVKGLLQGIKHHVPNIKVDEDTDVFEQIVSMIKSDEDYDSVIKKAYDAYESGYKKIWYDLGKLYFDINPKAAIDCLSKMDSTDESFPDSVVLKGEILLAQGDLKEAFAALCDAGDHPDATVLRGHILENMFGYSGFDNVVSTPMTMDAEMLIGMFAEIAQLKSQLGLIAPPSMPEEKKSDESAQILGLDEGLDTLSGL